MGHRHSAPLPPFEVISKRLTTKEVERAREALGFDKGDLTREVFLDKFGSAAGQAGRQVLARLFAALDANGTGCLEYEATRIERVKVVFAMYDTHGKGYLTRNDLLSYLVESQLANLEHGEVKRRSSLTQAPRPPPLYGSATTSPFRELAGTMADITFFKYDGDHDGKLNPSDFLLFSHQSESGVDDLLDCLGPSPYLSLPHHSGQG